MGDPARASISLTGDELGQLRDLLSDHADRAAIMAGQTRRGLDLLREASRFLDLVALVEAAIQTLPEDERPKPRPAQPPRGR